MYKDGAIRKVTMNKYVLALSWLKKLIPTLRMGDMDRIAYQKLLNDYAKYHERQTTMDFHHQLKYTKYLLNAYNAKASCYIRVYMWK